MFFYAFSILIFYLKDGDALRKIREKLGKKRKLAEKNEEEDKDVDFEHMIDEEKRAR